MTGNGFAGRILFVDVTTAATEVRPLDLDEARRFLGGWGMNAKLAYDLVPPRCDARAPEMPIIIGSGVLTGTSAPSTPKAFITTKCPAAGTVTTAVSGGDFGARLKWAGYDHLVITGCAAQPSYLYIRDEEVRLLPAGEFWGQDIYDATDALLERHGGDCSVACIGPAGENGVNIAMCLDNKLATFGRTVGANLGAKRLKAVVVAGSRGVGVADHKRFLKIAQQLEKKFADDPLREKWTKYALFFIAPMWAKAGHFITNNWSEVCSEERVNEHFGPEDFTAVKESTLSCPSCRSGDKASIRFEDLNGQQRQTTISCPITLVHGIGSRLGIYEMRDTTILHDRANRLGIDALTFASMLGWLRDLQRRGLLAETATDGAPLDFSTVSVVDWMEKTARREGFGAVLAGGYLHAIKTLGPEAEEHALQIKGTEPDFDARVSFGVETFGSVTNPRGGHDMPVGGLTVAVGRKPEFFLKTAQKMGFPPEALSAHIFSPEGFDLGRFQAHYENWCTVINCLGICFRMQCTRLYDQEVCAALYGAATGLTMTPAELMEGAERAYVLYRMLNAREGFSRADDRFPRQWFTPLKRNGGSMPLMDYFKKRPISREDAEAILDAYYEEKGWDVATGTPTAATLQRLGLSELLGVGV